LCGGAFGGERLRSSQSARLVNFMRVVPKRRIALVGADTLLGHEIKEVIEAAGGISIDSFAVNGEPNFGDEEGEAVFRHALDTKAVDGCDAIISAGSPEGAQKALAIARSQGGSLKLIDCTGALDQQAEARMCSFEQAAPPDSWLMVIAHPAAEVISSLLRKLAAYQPVTGAVIEIFEPASERGRLGMAELQQQTTGLLSFKALEKKVYDTQVSFALVPAYGEHSACRLDAIEQRIERHVASLISSPVNGGTVIPMPSLRLIQAPVFHGHTVSAWIEFSDHPDAARVASVLSSGEIDVRTAEHEMPSNAGIAGQSGFSVGDIRVDRNNSRALWLWAVADNLRIVADRVHEILRALEHTT
jgi:aspartate-semialdehyde dehydrogenase